MTCHTPLFKVTEGGIQKLRDIVNAFADDDETFVAVRLSDLKRLLRLEEKARAVVGAADGGSFEIAEAVNSLEKAVEACDV